MTEDTPQYYVWPVADGRTMTIAMLLLVGLFIGAVCLELYRRRRDRRLRLDAEWRGARELCEEREILDQDWKLVRAMLQQYASEHPYAAITKRTLFDECVTWYFQAFWAVESYEEVLDRGMRLREIRHHLGLDYVPYGRRIETTRSLQPGQLVWAVPAGGDPQEWYHFEIADVNEAIFSMSLVGRDTVPTFLDGTTLKFRLWREEDARYLFEAVLLREDRKNRHWTMRHADTMTRNQSRAYFRLRLEQAVTAAILNASRDEDYEGIFEREAVTEVRGRMTSLSGGGLAIVFQQPVPKQVLLRLSISIPQHGGSLTVAVRPVATQSLSGGRSFVRGTFVAMSDETRETITRYIFSKQKLTAGADADRR